MIVRTLKSASTAALFRSTTSREVVSRGDQMATPYSTRGSRRGRLIRSVAMQRVSFPPRRTIAWPEAASPRSAAARSSLHRMSWWWRGASVPFSIRAKEEVRLCSVLGGTGTEEELPPEPLVRRVADTLGTPRDVFWGNGQSRRLLVKSDGFGFALCQTLGNQDTDSPLQYRNHFESCYYVKGSGKYVWETGSHPIDTNGAGGTAFIMNRNDPHRMVVDDPSICISVFSPPIEGHESHDFSAGASSSY